MTHLRTERERAFEQCYSAHFSDLLAYARRRTDQPGDAADVVAETFLVAWRRIDEMPKGAETRLWLFGVARRVMANHRRSGLRRRRLGDHLRAHLEADAAGVVLGAGGADADHAVDVVRRSAVLAAMRTLAEPDREVLALSAWEQLEPREIAVVLEVSAGTVRTRLNRARGRLREALGDDFAPDGHVLSESTATNRGNR